MPTRDGVDSGSDEDGNLQVLLVDDDSRQQQAGRTLLSIWGIRPIVARNGSDAITLVMDRHFDIVLMAIVMPVKDGLSTTREMRQFEQEHGSKKKTPIIAYTSTELSPAVLQRIGPSTPY